MTVFTLLLGFVVLLTVGFLLALWRPRFRTDFPAPQLVVDTSPAEQVYRPIARLFTQRDMDFLHQQRGYRRNMVRRFRLERRQVLLLYLQDMHNEFRLLQRWCRVLARKTHNWELSALAHRQSFVFGGLLLAIRIRCLLCRFVYIQIDTADLVSSVRRLQHGVRQVMDSRDQSWLTG